MHIFDWKWCMHVCYLKIIQQIFTDTISTTTTKPKLNSSKFVGSILILSWSIRYVYVVAVPKHHSSIGSANKVSLSGFRSLYNVQIARIIMLDCCQLSSSRRNDRQTCLSTQHLWNSMQLAMKLNIKIIFKKIVIVGE